MTWFYRVSHSIMTPYTPGRLPKPTNQEVLEAMDDNTEDVSMVCRRIMKMATSDIEAILLKEVSP